MTSDPCSGRRNLFQKFESICSELMPVTNSTIVWISLLKITALIEYHKANMNHGSMPKSDRLSIAKTCGAPGPAIPRKWLLKHQSDKKAFLGCRLEPSTSSMNWHFYQSETTFRYKSKLATGSPPGNHSRTVDTSSTFLILSWGLKVRSESSSVKTRVKSSGTCNSFSFWI